MSSFELKFVDINTPLYKEAVLIRDNLFFQNMVKSLDLINDDYELNGIHLVCLNEGKAIGCGRLNIENDISIISQMAIKEEFQKNGIGTQIIKEFIGYSKKNKISEIRLSARETAVSFYEKFNFRVFGDKYPSNKTGIIHQQMVLKIK